MAKKKIAFVVAIPMTARAFLMDHIAYLQKEYEVHLVANFPTDDDKKEFEAVGLICHSAPIQRSITIFGDLKGLFALKKTFQEGKV